MNNFEYYAPTRVIFGKDVETRAGELCKWSNGSKVFVVYGGGSAIRSGLIARVEESLKNASIAYELYGGARANPTLEHAEEGVRRAAAFGADMVLGVGGGSAIDTAKGIAHGAANPGVDLWDIWTLKQPLTKSLPVGVILTIPAAGSEMSNSAVLTNTATTTKRGLGTDYNRPKFALMNPALASTLPKEQIACGVCDTLMHTLDRYFHHVTGNELTDAFAEALLRVTMNAGRKAYVNPNDYDAMSDLMWCSSVSHNGLTGLGGAMDFVPHKLGHEISARFDTPHGESLTMVWSSWARYVMNENPARFARFANTVFGIDGTDALKAARDGIDAMERYFISLDMPVSLSAIPQIGDVSGVASEMAEATQVNSGVGFGACKRMYKEDAEAIYNSSYANKRA